MMECKPKKLVRFDESQHIEKPLPVEGGKRYIALSKYEGGGGGGEGGTTLNNVDGRSRRKNVGMGVRPTTTTTTKLGGGRFTMVMPAPAAAGAAAENQQPQRPKSQLRILDPASQVYVQWNRVFLFWSLVGLFVDPLFFYVPSVVKEEEENVNGVSSSRMDTDLNLGITVTCFRTFADIFYLLHILVKLRTAYVSPSSRVFGKGELVTDANKIATRYLKSDFFIDLIAALPLPQIMIWFIIPAVKASKADNTNNALALIVLLQYVPRLYLIFPLSSEIIKANGVVTKTAWAGAAYNLLLYLLASHVLGASWYLISIERHATCWKSVCRGELAPVKCSLAFLDCDSWSTNDDRRLWRNSTQVFSSCDPGNPSSSFQYGIFGNAVSQNVVSTDFLEKYLYCLWWGLQNLSSYGQSLSTTTFVWETLFAILIACLGLVLFAHLIGNMQTYLQSITVRFEEWRLKQRDTEEWMRHRQLPENLQERVRRFDQYKWIATRGVDAEFILRALPKDLRRDIQRHLCLDLVLRVPFFSQMDGQPLDAICERLVSRLSTQGSYIVREGDPVTEILFVIRGRLESSTTNGGRAGFFNSISVGAGGVCGDELLSWALLSKSALNLPSSTRTVKALEEVEAFALPAEDLKFVANQFRRLHSRKLQHTFRFYSDHWRTWAACFIQAAWRRFKKRMMAKSLSMSKSFAFLGVDEQAGQYEASPAAAATQEDQEEDHIGIIGSNTSSSIHSSSSTSRINQNLGVTILTSRFAANTRRGAPRSKDVEISTKPKLEKPVDPDSRLFLGPGRLLASWLNFTVTHLGLNRNK